MSTNEHLDLCNFEAIRVLNILMEIDVIYAKAKLPIRRVLEHKIAFYQKLYKILTGDVDELFNESRNWRNSQSSRRCSI